MLQIEELQAAEPAFRVSSSRLPQTLARWFMPSAATYYYYCNHMIFELLLESRLQSVVRIVTRQSQDL
jgi:hypothetical protein